MTPKYEALIRAATGLNKDAPLDVTRLTGASRPLAIGSPLPPLPPVRRQPPAIHIHLHLDRKEGTENV